MTAVADLDGSRYVFPTMSDSKPIEHDLLESFIGTTLVTDKVTIQPTSIDDKHVVIEGRLAVEDDQDDVEDLVEAVAFGFLFTLGVLSFADAVPAGNSGEYGFRPDDQLTGTDLLRHVQFRRGELRLSLDYLRGRMLKTTVVVRQDGTFEVTTMNRGIAATKWIERLQGKEPKVEKEPPTPQTPPQVLN